MSKLTKAMRQEVLNGVMSDAFITRFGNIKVGLNEAAHELLKREHRVFLELRNRKEVYGYLSCHHNLAPHWGDEKYTHCFSRPKTLGEYAKMSLSVYGQEDTTIITIDTVVPASGFTMKLAKDHPVVVEYLKVWEDYTAAQLKLLVLLWAYESREKFEADLPEFAKHLPARVVTMKPPRVIVKDVMAELAKFGVPLGEEK